MKEYSKVTYMFEPVFNDESRILNSNNNIEIFANGSTAGASKATPGFDVINYGQEDYVFGSSEKDARHWDINKKFRLTNLPLTIHAFF